MNDLSDRRAEPISNLHVVFGSGGSKAILGGAGAILAFEVAGLRRWLSVGSCSGGSMPALLLASGKPTKEIMSVVIERDFTKLLKPKSSLFGRLVALLFKYRYEVTRPQRGVYSAEPMVAFFEDWVGSWPQGFWTVSSGKKGDYVFTEGAAYFEQQGWSRQLTLPRPTIGQAVNATCAVPGFIDGVRYGNDLLHDGALSSYGECPAAVPVRYFGARPDQVLAFDIEPEALKNQSWLKLAWRAACMGQCGTFDANHINPADGYLLIRPNITGFHGLQFDLSRETKWRALCTGFDTTAATLLSRGLVQGFEAVLLRSLAAELKEICEEAKGPAFIRQIENLLTRLDLFAPRRKL